MGGRYPRRAAWQPARLFAARAAYAKIVANTISSEASVTHGGRRLTLTGPLQCDARERVALRVTVTQRSTGAVAEGTGYLIANGGLQQRVVDVSAQTRGSFVPGPATAVGLARTTVNDRATDAHQWLVPVTLVQ